MTIADAIEAIGDPTGTQDTQTRRAPTSFFSLHRQKSSEIRRDFRG
jgi:hypothetical protein